MRAYKTLRIAATFVAPILPLLVFIWAVHQPEFVMLTGPVPHMPVGITIAVITYFVIFGVICWKEIPAIKVAGALWIYRLVSARVSLYIEHIIRIENLVIMLRSMFVQSC